MKNKTISIVGLGYIGLPTAAVFASRKMNVIGVDVNKSAVDTINRGEIHIAEPDLDMVVHAAVKEGYLKATTVPEPADAFLIAVPTPFKDGYKPDLSFIESACKSIAPVLKDGDLVILESTSPVGATEQMADWLASARPDLTFPQTHGEDSNIRIAHCPERVLPGHVLRELVQNDRVVGGMTNKCSVAAVKLYKTFVEGQCIITNARTAEMCKLTENSFRDVNIAFANELSLICEKFDINVWELIKLANLHPRVNILQPGPGVGGHCIAVDPWFIVSAAPEESKLICAARNVNDFKPKHVLSKIVSAIKGRSGIKVACFGLAFKPDIDDLRESPALDIVLQLAELEIADLMIVEPNIEALPSSLSRFNNVQLCDIDFAIDESDIIVMLVNHKEFCAVPVSKVNGKVLIDTRGVWQ